MGKDGDLPWRCPADLKYFKQLTTGHPIIMGRRTYESIGRPLPGRTSIVLSRAPREEIGAVRWCATAERALAEAAAAPGGEHAFVIGGKEIYLLLWDRLTAVHHSLIDAPDAEGDLWFDLPLLRAGGWQRVSSEPREGFRLDVWERELPPTASRP
jgi:dihydrofolate reductase